MIVDQILFTYQDNLLGYKSNDIILSQTQQEPVIFENSEPVQSALLEELSTKYRKYMKTLLGNTVP